MPRMQRHQEKFSTLEILGMSKANTSDVLVITASNGENLKLAQRFVEMAGNLGQSRQPARSHDHRPALVHP